MTPKEQFRIDRAKRRRQRNKERFYRWRMKHPQRGTCRVCGSHKALWCDICNMWSCHECDMYGTCMCS